MYITEGEKERERNGEIWKIVGKKYRKLSGAAARTGNLQYG